jgi:adenosylhomocysteine nucleosidase
MHKPVAIIAAMPAEVAPLVRHSLRRSVAGVMLYELPSALIALGGMGRKPAQRAAEVALQEANPSLLVSAGFAGALAPGLQPGEVLTFREVADEATGEHYATTSGEAVLVSSPRVAGVNHKRSLAQSFAASAVDMEAAAVAEVARRHGIPFAAVKAISDDLEFPMPPVSGFIDRNGRLRAPAFLAHVAVRPKWWIPLLRLARNSGLASRNLGKFLQHLIQQHAYTEFQEKSSLA